ncbi:MAG TPA: MFS transporter [Bacteroidales bacterium]|nr:MAG: hypothetical protein A2X11_03900 [Bacteroidetes bacterium GWE2_42_24]OFY26097.1 MAG: hypothetical protein A2X09_11605 [Bacteroidetes bacterium GWF2_43_11]HAQ65258.1 MFS transporter [Bacteroidales bacterium]HBZ65409.1 MFS transporter [Bacteroidales bacterium]
MTPNNKPTEASRRSVMTVLITGVLMGALDISIVGPALPSIERTLWMDPLFLSWIFSVYVLASLAGIPLMSRLSDVFGRRNIYVTAVGIFGLGSLVVSLTDNYVILLIGRGIQGFGVSGILPVASAVIGDIYPPEKRGRMLGLIGAVFGVAFIIGPVLAGTVLHFFRWNALFFINVPISFILILVSLRTLPSKAIATADDIDIRGIITLTAGLIFITLGISNLKPDHFFHSLTDPITLIWFTSAVLSITLLVAIERQEPFPVVKLEFLFNKQVRLVGLMAFGLGLFQASFVFVPQLIIFLFRVDESTAGFMLIPVITGSAIAAPLAGQITDWKGSRVVILAGLIIAATGLLLTGTLPHEKWLIYLAGALIGIGFSMRSSLNYIMLSEADRRDRASAQGLLTIFISLGQLTGASMIGAIAAAPSRTGGGFGMAFTLCGIIAIGLAVAALFLKGQAAELKTARENDA